MLIHPHGERKNLILSIIILALFTGLVWLVISSYQKRQNESSDSGMSTRVSVEGYHACLPHKDTSGPVTMECAFGIRLDDGTYYALDLSLLSTDVLMQLETERRIKVEGLMVPIEAISADHWQKYDIKGIIAVTSASIID